VLLVACLSALISVFSPFWGLIFIFVSGAKYQSNNLVQKFYSIFLLAVVIFFLGRIVDVISFFDILIGVALSSYLFFRILTRRFNYLQALLSVYLLNVTYGIIRHLLFSKRFLENISVVTEEYMKLLNQSMTESPERLTFLSELIETMKYIITNFYPGIWVFSFVLAVYIGSLLISAKMRESWSHKLVRLPFELVYLLIASLGIFLSGKFRIAGINGLVMLLPLFLIQGFSILDYYWGDYLKKVKVLLVLLIIALVFNPYLIIIIAVLGLTDIWFDFRKLSIREEIDESNLD